MSEYCILGIEEHAAKIIGGAIFSAFCVPRASLGIVSYLEFVHVQVMHCLDCAEYWRDKEILH